MNDSCQINIRSSDLEFPRVLAVTEQDIDISMLNARQRQFYIDLFKSFIEAYTKQGQARTIIGIAGPTGAGKSVMTSLFVALAKQVALPFQFKVVTIDAFHYTNAELQSKTTTSGGSLREHKGRYDTYDTSKLKTALTSFLNGEAVEFPAYSRKLHNPVEAAINIQDEKCLLVIEGLWLLYGQFGWEAVRNMLNFTVFVTADKDRVRDAVLKRHINGGKTKEQAEKHYKNVDGVNFDIVMATRFEADQVIPPYYELV
jgi:pantothenate kinase